MKKTTGRISHLAAAFVLAAVLVFGTCLTAFADNAGTPNLDLSETGSISVSLYSEEAEAYVTDGALTIYRVADLYLDDGNEAFTYTDAFAGCDESLEDVTAPLLADKLAAYVEDNGITGVAENISEDGSVTFSNLALGLYLIMQTTDSTGYYAVEPFLVTVPQDVDGVWVYNVNAGPKVEVIPTPAVPEEPTPEEPTPEGTITPSTPTPTPTGSVLPQTGQLVWPIPILAAAGLVCCLIGWKMKRTDRRNRMHAA